MDDCYLWPEWENLASILIQFFVFINVNTKKACFYKSMVMERVCLRVLCNSFNSKFYIKKLHIYHQKVFLIIYHLTSALPTIFLKQKWATTWLTKGFVCQWVIHIRKCLFIFCCEAFTLSSNAPRWLRFLVHERRLIGRGEVWMRSRYFHQRCSQKMNFSKEYVGR